MVLDVQQLSLEWPIIHSRNFVDDSRVLERDIHDVAVRAESQTGCLLINCELPVQNREESTKMIPAMHSRIPPTILAEVQYALGVIRQQSCHLIRLVVKGSTAGRVVCIF